MVKSWKLTVQLQWQALNPGNGRTDLGRTSNPFLARIVIPILSYPPLYTAYTEIFAAFSSEVTSGSWVIPFGRMGVQEHLSDAAKSEAEGGMGVASKFWEWQEEQVKSFL